MSFIPLLLWRTSLRYLFRHPWQLALAILGIALGVAVVVAVDLANESARRSFSLSSEQIMGRTTHQIISPQGRVPDSVYTRLRVKHALRNSAPVVSGNVALADDPSRLLQVLGGDLFAETRFQRYSLTSADDGETLEATTLLLTPNTAFLSARTAAQINVQQGDTLRLLAAEGYRTLTITNLLADENGLFSNLLITDIATAQALFNQQGFLSHIDLILNDDTAIEHVKSLLPPNLQLITATTRNAGVAQLTNSFHLNLSAMSLLALIVGMFLIYNSMTFAVVQRRELFGQLRTLGITRHELFRLVMTEALLLGLIGTVLGLLLGLWLGSLLVGLVTRTINDLYYVMTVREFSLAPLSLLKGLLLGSIAPLIAAWLPAREAAQASPRLVLSRHKLEMTVKRSLPLLILSGLASITMGLLMLVLPGLLAGFAGLFLILLGCALLTPPVIAWLVGWLAKLPFSSLLLRMALRDQTRHLSRTGMATAALMVALSATVSIQVMVSSFRSTVSVWLKDTLNADIYLAPVSLQSQDEAVQLIPEVLTALQSRPEIRAWSTYRTEKLLLDDGRPLQLTIVSLAKTSQDGYRFLDGDPASIWQAFQQPGAVLITEPLAYRHHLSVGDKMTLPTPQGKKDFKIVGVFYDYGSEHGRVMMHDAVWQQFWPAMPPRTAGLYLHDGYDTQSATDTLQREIGHLQPLRFTNRQTIREISLDIFDRTFAITNVLRLLAIGVAFVGLLSALLALQMERTRPLAVLRAIGMTTREAGVLVILDSALMGLFAGLIAIPVGFVLGSILILVINSRAFGWTMQFQFDPGIPLETLLLSISAAVLAGMYPAWRLARTSPARALREE